MPSNNILTAALPTFLFRNRKQSYEMNPADQTFEVEYMGNVITYIGRGDASIDRPLNVILKTWNTKKLKQHIQMSLFPCSKGIKAETQFGTTDYFAHRITWTAFSTQYPRVFCWVYKHEGKRMKSELRCHAVLCKKASDPQMIQQRMIKYLKAALQEYKREKLAAERTRKNSLILNGAWPRRKQFLQTGINFRPPASQSSAIVQRLGSINEEEEETEEEEDINGEQQNANDEEEDFFDIDCNSLNLDAHYRNLPFSNLDSSSQQSSSANSLSEDQSQNNEIIDQFDCNSMESDSAISASSFITSPINQAFQVLPSESSNTVIQFYQKANIYT